MEHLQKGWTGRQNPLDATVMQEITQDGIKVSQSCLWQIESLLKTGHVVQVADTGFAEERGVGFTGKTRREGGKMQPDSKDNSSLRHTLVVETGN